MNIEEVGQLLKHKRIVQLGSTYKVVKNTDLGIRTIQLAEEQPETITMKTLKKLSQHLDIDVFIDLRKIDDYAEIGSYISQMRILKKLTYKEIADQIGNDQNGKPLITLQAIRHIEQNADKAKIINLMRILNVLKSELIIK